MGSETVLLVEDEDAVRTLAKQVLKRYGYNVLDAEGGEAACRIAAQHHIDVLVTDVVMPHMNGRELATTLRARIDDLKVVFMSGYTGEAAALESSMDGAVFLPKPFTAAGLAGAVRKLLDEVNASA
jgi:two-component system cell cycle sensor histidine kinase/response regulator CckA